MIVKGINKYAYRVNMSYIDICICCINIAYLKTRIMATIALINVQLCYYTTQYISSMLTFSTKCIHNTINIDKLLVIGNTSR